MNFLTALTPEIILAGMACLLFVLAAFPSVMIRRATPWLALASMMAALYVVITGLLGGAPVAGVQDTLLVTGFATYIRIAALTIGSLLVLLNWPTNKDATGNSCLWLEREAPEYFALMLLSLTGVMLVALANDLILFFLAIELAAIPTYVMVSISRPIAVAQEAALKYFFLGAFSAAITLFGLSFIFGATGSLTFTGTARMLGGADAAGMSAWLMMGGILLVLGLAFKMAAFPLHFYAPDVYTGAATPLTALLSFVPKAAGIVGLIRVLYALGGDFGQHLPAAMTTTLWVIAVLTMTVGNVLGLMQQNIKRMMACSSIAHSGYMLSGVYVLFSTRSLMFQEGALDGVLFYLMAYGLMNIGVFAVLMMLPAKSDPFVHDGKIPPATSAETFSEITGTGRNNVGLGLIMAVCCFGLIGIPLTVGFFGKFYLIRPALSAGNYWLVVIMVLNAAISAGYYLRIISAMFLKEPRTVEGAAETPAGVCDVTCIKTVPLVLAGVVSAGASLLLGTYMPSTEALRTLTRQSLEVMPHPSIVHEDESQTPSPAPAQQ